MRPRILVINPNSNANITRAINQALQCCHLEHDVDFSCSTLADGPFAIETDEDISVAVPLVVSEICNNEDCDAFIIACYADPGLNESRAVSKKPVFGIHESAVSLSATFGRRFGVLALGRDSIQRHIAYIRQLGYQAFHAGERPLDVNVGDAVNDLEVLQEIIDTGRQLIDEDGAETLILGCAGLAAYRQAAQLELGVPLIDPVQAAITIAAEALAGH
ncbi:MAG: aspartate/glutamate racemase family protein [Proteobacteria bacterium]|nr:aspartate/glutamate racemase family protein [Pseudomonadota bacterium]